MNVYELMLPTKETFVHSANLTCAFLPLQQQGGQTAALSAHYTTALSSIQEGKKVLKTELSVETVQNLQDFLSQFCSTAV